MFCVIHPPPWTEMFTHFKHAFANLPHISKIALLHPIEATGQPDSRHFVLYSSKPRIKFGSCFNGYHWTKCNRLFTHSQRKLKSDRFKPTPAHSRRGRFGWLARVEKGLSSLPLTFLPPIPQIATKKTLREYRISKIQRLLATRHETGHSLSIGDRRCASNILLIHCR